MMFILQVLIIKLPTTEYNKLHQMIGVQKRIIIQQQLLQSKLKDVVSNLNDRGNKIKIEVENSVERYVGKEQIEQYSKISQLIVANTRYKDSKNNKIISNYIRENIIR